MAITPKNGDLTAGVAGRWTETIDAEPALLVTGDAPAQASMPLPAAAAQTFAAREVVMFDVNGQIVPAEEGTPAIGYVVYANTSATTAGQLIEVMRQGVFNPDALVWDASYDTDEKKRLAFEGAASPTSIILRKPQTMTV